MPSECPRERREWGPTLRDVPSPFVARLSSGPFRSLRSLQGDSLRRDGTEMTA